MAEYNQSGSISIKMMLWVVEVDFFLNMLMGAFVMLLFGYLFGQLAGKSILIKGKNPVLTGILTGLEVLVTTGFLSGWLGFFQEGIYNFGQNSTPFFNYIIKPMAWVVIFGFIPAALMGIWFGTRIKKQGARAKDNDHAYPGI